MNVFNTIVLVVHQVSSAWASTARHRVDMAREISCAVTGKVGSKTAEIMPVGKAMVWLGCNPAPKLASSAAQYGLDTVPVTRVCLEVRTLLHIRVSWAP